MSNKSPRRKDITESRSAPPPTAHMADLAAIYLGDLWASLPEIKRWNGMKKVYM